MVEDVVIARLKTILESVPDPEIPVLSIADMGILRNVSIKNEKVIVTITPTYSGCPAMDMISANIKSILNEYGYLSSEVNFELSPAWTTELMSEDGLKKLKDYGIAPPPRLVNNQIDKSWKLQCPLCESIDTILISHFGSTPCKALYRCNHCLEPFDHFKCH